MKHLAARIAIACFIIGLATLLWLLHLNGVI